MISVVIPVLDAEATLGAQLTALATQSCPDPWEVVVADNGSSDASVEVAESFADRLTLRIVDASARRGPAAARNRGAAAAHGDRLLFCDADDVVLAGWIEALASAIAPGRCATGPYLVVDRIPGAHEDLEEWRSTRTAPPQYLGQVPMIQSNNFAAARTDFAGVGGFDETLRCGEDADLGVRLVQLGCRVTWCPDARIVSRNRSTSSEQFRQFLAYGRWDVTVYRKHRGGALHRPRVRAALRDYASLVVHLPRLFRRDQRRSWIVTAGQRTGRLVGSVKDRTLCL